MPRPGTDNLSGAPRHPRHWNRKQKALRRFPPEGSCCITGQESFCTSATSCATASGRVAQLMQMRTAVWLSSGLPISFMA